MSLLKLIKKHKVSIGYKIKFIKIIFCAENGFTTKVKLEKVLIKILMGSDPALGPCVGHQQIESWNTNPLNKQQQLPSYTKLCNQRA